MQLLGPFQQAEFFLSESPEKLWLVVGMTSVLKDCKVSISSSYEASSLTNNRTYSSIKEDGIFNLLTGKVNALMSHDTRTSWHFSLKTQDKFVWMRCIPNKYTKLRWLLLKHYENCRSHLVVTNIHEHVCVQSPDGWFFRELFLNITLVRSPISALRMQIDWRNWNILHTKYMYDILVCTG